MSSNKIDTEETGMAIDIFISYHTETSLQIVKEITKKLESNGIKCWYSDRDSQGAYADSIVRAIEECRVFILVLNKDASESPHVLNELDVVTKRLAKKEMVDIIPFHIADNDISRGASYYIERWDWIDATIPPLEQRIIELVDRIASIINKRDKRVYLYRKSNDEIIELQEGIFNIGRGEKECQYCIKDNNKISKMHVCINVTSNAVALMDLSSTNHSYINDHMLESKKSVLLAVNDVIRLADEEFVFLDDAALSQHREVKHLWERYASLAKERKLLEELIHLENSEH